MTGTCDSRCTRLRHSRDSCPSTPARDCAPSGSRGPAQSGVPFECGFHLRSGPGLEYAWKLELPATSPLTRDSTPKRCGLVARVCRVFCSWFLLDCLTVVVSSFE